MKTPPERDRFGVRTLYADSAGRLFGRIDEAGRTTLNADAVRAWQDGSFDASTQLVNELRPLKLSKADGELGSTATNLSRALDASTRELGKFGVAGMPDSGERTTPNFPSPIHCLLSGGIDSAAIVDSLHRHGHEIIAHALVDDAVDEAELARGRKLAAKLSVPLLEHRITEEELPAFFEQAVIAAERPIFNARGVSLALFMKKLARGGVTRAFCGIGADEVFHPNREHIVRTVFEPKTLPPTVWAARAFGLELMLPYLTDPFVAAADALPTAPDKRAFREAMREKLGEEICFAPKSPRMFRPVTASSLWRNIVKGGDDAAALSAASFAVLERHFANGTTAPRHLT